MSERLSLWSERRWTPDTRPLDGPYDRLHGHHVRPLGLATRGFNGRQRANGRHWLHSVPLLPIIVLHHSTAFQRAEHAHFFAKCHPRFCLDRLRRHIFLVPGYWRELGSIWLGVQRRELRLNGLFD